jgi:hypothetical protein
MKKEFKILLNTIVITIIILALVSGISISSKDKEAINKCKINCTAIKNIEIKNYTANYNQCKINCENSQCVKLCNNERKNCIKYANEDRTECSKSCPYTIENNLVTCTSRTNIYKAGQKFMENCSICQCGYNGKIKCENTKNCNFNNFTISKSDCESSNGLYQQLCTGPYFGIKCSADYYCQCEGDNNYQCPEDYVCIKNFYVDKIRTGDPRWKNFLGKDLGDIGICAKNQNIESCGNGICNNLIVNRGDIPENHLNCPQDC